MPTEPLRAFSPPTSLSFTIPGITPHTLILIFFCFAILYWIVYTAVAMYHWLTYSHNSAVAFPAVTTHLGVSFVLIVFALSGLV